MTEADIVVAWRERIVKKNTELGFEEDDWQSLWKGFVCALAYPELANYSNYMRLGFPIEEEAI